MKHVKNENINNLLNDMLTEKKDAIKLNNGAYMAFNIDYLGKRAGYDTFAFSHYYKDRSGDMIADPDMEAFYAYGVLYPYAYQDSFGYQNAIQFTPEGKICGVRMNLQARHAKFMRQWFENVVQQQGIMSEDEIKEMQQESIDYDKRKMQELREFSSGYANEKAGE